MRKLLSLIGLVTVAALAGAILAWLFLRKPAERSPDGPALILKVREVARLETLDVSLYKKVSFAPDPQPSESVWGGVAEWARFSVRPPKGKAIVFALAHLSLDLGKLDAGSLRTEGRRVLCVLPKVETRVELKPAETEIIGSNLDSAETAQLFELAREAFEREVAADEALRERARESGRRALRAIFFGAGMTEVKFVDRLPEGARLN